MNARTWHTVVESPTIIIVQCRGEKPSPEFALFQDEDPKQWLLAESTIQPMPKRKQLV